MAGHEEKFKQKITIKQKFDKLTEGWFGYVVYAALGILIAFLVNQTLAYGLSTDLPVVAVVSGSMVHDSSTQTNHYQWLENNMGYSKSEVDSWPIKDGFSVGDLPIIQGTDENKNYKAGDVIVYSISGQSIPIIHRVIKINPDGSYMTKGDHNPTLLPFESSVKSEQVHGKVIFIIPKLGYFKVAVSKLTGGAI